MFNPQSDAGNLFDEKIKGNCLNLTLQALILRKKTTDFDV